MGSNREVSQPVTTSEEAIFNALCRVHGEANADESPGAALARLLRFASATPANDEDDFPDFSEERERSRASDVPAEAAVTEEASPGQDAVVRALLETLGSYRGLLDRYNEDFDSVFARRRESEPEDDDETIRRLRGAQTLLVKYPVAAQAAFAALAREGRRFAKTKDGQAWKKRLGPSPLLAKARTLFEGLANGVLAEKGGPLPSVYVEEFVHALDRELESVLAEVADTRRP
jgi:hypothetical protein